VTLKEFGETSTVPVSILDDVRQFHAEVMSGEYYEAFDVNSKNSTQLSRGTQAFVAEFDRLARRCVRTTKTVPRAAVRPAFELFFSSRTRVDHGSLASIGARCSQPIFGVWPRQPQQRNLRWL
jgi:hypothetical protein